MPYETTFRPLRDACALKNLNHKEYSLKKLLGGQWMYKAVHFFYINRTMAIQTYRYFNNFVSDAEIDTRIEIGSIIRRIAI